MKIEFDYEISDMTADRQLSERYLECEKVIVYNVRKHISRGHDDKSITNYPEKVSAYFTGRIETSQKTNDCTNYRNVQGSINTLIKMPCWRSWAKTIDK